MRYLIPSNYSETQTITPRTLGLRGKEKISYQCMYCSERNLITETQSLNLSTLVGP